MIPGTGGDPLDRPGPGSAAGARTDPRPVWGADTDVERLTRATLESAARKLADAGCQEVADALAGLAAQVGGKCVVAVVGQVNSGKSTFINALLEDDKAVTGNTETTATINYFTHGHPDPQRPVRCHWRSGHVTPEPVEMLAGLQGRDETTLRKAEGIDYLEFVMPNPMLAAVTLVDTPGTGTVVEEHQNQTADYLALAARLRARHDEETSRLRDAADAIIYLVGAIARSSDQEMLEQFTGSLGPSPGLNAVGVLAKVDLEPVLLAQRHDLAGKIQRQLRANLSSVLPVSAALARATARLIATEGRLEAILECARVIPPDQLALLLQNEALFRDYDLPECPVPAARRRALHDSCQCPWGTFTLLMRTAAENPQTLELTAALEEVCGMRAVRETLQEQFFARSVTLRCHRIIRDAQALLRQHWYQVILPGRRQTTEHNQQLSRYVAFLEEVAADAPIGRELRDYLQARIQPGMTGRLTPAWKDAEAQLARLGTRLGDHDEDFRALIRLSANDRLFPAAELEELRGVLGMYGTHPRQRLNGTIGIDHVARRQMYWAGVRDRLPHASPEWAVADRAFVRYGILLDELSAAVNG